MNLIGGGEFNGCNTSTEIWRNYLNSLTTNLKDFEGDPIVSHKSTMDRLSKGNYTWISVIKNYLVQLQKYREVFIFL